MAVGPEGNMADREFCFPYLKLHQVTGEINLRSALPLLAETQCVLLETRPNDVELNL